MKRSFGTKLYDAIISKKEIDKAMAIRLLAHKTGLNLNQLYNIFNDLEKPHPVFLQQIGLIQYLQLSQDELHDIKEAYKESIM